jgi:hypothetical protein
MGREGAALSFPLLSLCAPLSFFRREEGKKGGLASLSAARPPYPGEKEKREETQVRGSGGLVRPCPPSLPVSIED